MNTTSDQTARLREALTPAEVTAVQVWLLHRDRALAYPAGVRRRTDRGPHVRRPLRQWRELFQMTRVELARAITARHSASGRQVRYETIRALEDGVASWDMRASYLPRIAAVFGVQSDQILLPG